MIRRRNGKPKPPVVLPPSATQQALLGWQQPLGTTVAEDRPGYNGTNDTSNNRANTSYAQRLVSGMAITDTSSPVAGLFGYGGNQIVDTSAGPLYIVPNANHPRRLVQWRFNNGSGADADLSTANGLQTKLQSVPVPVAPDGSRFEPYYGRNLDAAGPDQQLAIYDPFTKEYWEFWLWTWNSGNSRYECGYAGYQANCDQITSRTVLPNGWGARATGVPLTTVILRADWENGSIDHMLGLGVPVGLPGYIPPATRQDAHLAAVPFDPVASWAVVNHDGRLAIPEGAIFRLPSNYVIETNHYPGNAVKSKAYALITKAFRDYGLIIYDSTGGTYTLSMEGKQAVGTPYSPIQSTSVPLEGNPQDGLFWGPGGIMHDLPWSQMYQVKYTG